MTDDIDGEPSGPNPRFLDTIPGVSAVTNLLQGTRDTVIDWAKGIHRLQLGNLECVVSSWQFPKDQIPTLFQRLTEAHSRLEEYFGPEVMGATTPRQVQLVVNPLLHGNAHAGMRPMDHLPDGQMVMRTEPSTLELPGKTVPSLQSLLHELFHIEVQPYSPWYSTALYEGHAGAVSQLLCPEDERVCSPIFAIDPALNGALNEGGWDLPMGESTRIESDWEAARNEDMVIAILKDKWKQDWLRFAGGHPDFFRKFYEAVHASEENFETKVTYDHLLALAEKVEPDFLQWREQGDGRSMQLPDPDVPSQIIHAVLHDDDVYIVDLQTTGRQDYNSPGRYYTGSGADVRLAQNGEPFFKYGNPHSNPIITRLQSSGPKTVATEATIGEHEFTFS